MMHAVDRGDPVECAESDLSEVWPSESVPSSVFRRFNESIVDISVEGTKGQGTLFNAFITTAINRNLPPHQMQLLLDRRMDVNHRGKTGKTPLHFAVSAQNADFVDALMAFRA